MCFLAASIALAAEPRTPVEPGPVLDPGLRDNATPPSERDRSKRSNRVIRPDFIDEIIVKLPAAEMNFKAGAADDTCEKLVYDITVNRLPHAKATFELRSSEKDDKPVWNATLSTRSNRAATLFYEVRDTIRSTFDEKAGFSRFFFMDRKEGDAHVIERITMNYEKDKMEATYERQKPSLNNNNEVRWVPTTITLTDKVLDPLSAVYYLRSKGLDLKSMQPGKTTPALTLPICTERHVFNTNFYAVGIDHPDIGNLKDRECVVFEIDAPFKGLFERVGRVKVWVDVKKGVVLKMKSETPIGPAEAILSEHIHSPLEDPD